MFRLFKEMFVDTSRLAQKNYQTDVALNNSVIQKIRTYNDYFSETFFSAWIDNTFIRYSFLLSKRPEKVQEFEKVHLYKETKKNWIDNIRIFDYFKNVYVDKVDFLNFIHSEDEDIILIKLCVVGKDIIGKEQTEIKERRVYYYDIELVKKNGPNVKYSNIISNCPNCGAPSSVGTFGICEHCQESISIYDNIWKVKDIKLDI